MQNEEPPIKRLFFGLEVLAPWPEHFPKGRLLDESRRHMTVLFLGNVPYDKVEALLSKIPPLPHRISLVGKLNELLFLSPRHPKVVAAHVDFFEDPSPLFQYQKELAALFKQQEFAVDERDFLAHVTLCRAPFDRKAWEARWHPLPCMIKDLHLYESTGGLRYVPVWTMPMHSAFVEIEHVADIAYRIYGETLEQLYLHAQIALAFRCPEMLPYISVGENLSSLEEVIIHLNALVSRLDAEIGSPFKAVSFHGEITKTSSGFLEWEMIVDV